MIAAISGSGRLSPLQRREALNGYFAIMPWLLGFIIFIAGPMIYSLGLMFTKWDLLTPPVFNGLANFQRLAQDPTFFASLGNTVFYTALAVPLQLLVALCVALLLNTNIVGQNLYRAVIFLPSQIPIVATALLWFFIYSPTNGLANAIMGGLGLPQQRWLWDIHLVKPALIVMTVWMFGNAMIIFLAGLQDIPQQLYEAAEIDGAGMYRRLRHVTLPLLSPTIFFNLVIGIIGSFQVFIQVFIMTDGGPGTASMMYVLYLYRIGFEELNMGYAALLSWILFLIVLLITLVQFGVARRWVHYEGERDG